MLRYSLLTAGLMLGASAFAAPAGDLPLMPWPAKVERPTTQGALELNNQLTVSVSGDDLGDAVNRLRQRIALQTGWTLQPQAEKPDKPTIRIAIAKKVKPQPLPDSDESYKLTVDANGVNISANTRFGALRAMETLLQLMQNGAENTSIPWVTIEDSPRFPWRGLLLDSARHFLPIPDIKRQIDGMAAAKLNVLHWHLTDDQGWRFSSKRYPKLTQLASDGLFYTPEQMREIVRYAAERGIRVVPEIDMPGHASAIAVAYPELMSAPGPYAMERHWGVLKPVLDPTKEATYTFADAMVSELAAIFPDPYLHIGGDEVDDSQWKANAAIQRFLRDNKLADSHALQAYFNRKLETILEKHHRQMVGWDEIYHPDLPKSILIQSWQGQDALGQVAQNGYKGILSTGFYLDQPQSTAYHYRNEIVPQGLNGVDVIADTDSVQSWAFSMPRLKGKPVEGSFTLVKGDAGWRGFIDFAGKSRRAVDNIQWRDDNQVTFTVDTWMGETRPVVSVENDKLSGYFLVGNARYPISGTRLDAVPKAYRRWCRTRRTRPICSAVKPRCGRKTWSRRCWISVCGRAPLRWRSGYGRRRTSTTSTTCIPGSRRWTAGRRCRLDYSSIPSSRCSSRASPTMRIPCRCKFSPRRLNRRSITPASILSSRLETIISLSRSTGSLMR